MPITKPSSLPRWATSGASITEPSSGKKDIGWIVEKPPAEYFNWWQNVTYLWTFFVDAVFSVLTVRATSEAGAALETTASGSQTFGAKFTGNGASEGVQGIGGGTNGIGLKGFGGASNGHGVKGEADGTGRGVWGIGGDSDGAGVRGEGGTTNGKGVEGQGAGTGQGGYFTGGGSNAIGAEGFGTGTAAGLKGTGGATGPGVVGQGGASGAQGVYGAGTGSSPGVEGIGAANASGVYGTGGAGNAHGVEGHGTGTGHGVYGVAGTSGDGVRGEASTSAQDGVVGRTTAGSSTGVLGLHEGAGSNFDGAVVGRSTTAYGVIAESDSTSPSRSAFRIVPQDADPTTPQQGDLYVNSGNGKLMLYNGSAWVVVGSQS